MGEGGSSSVESNGRKVEPASSSGGGGGFVFGQNLADRASNFSETTGGASTDSATSSMTKGTQSRPIKVRAPIWNAAESGIPPKIFGKVLFQAQCPKIWRLFCESDKFNSFFPLEINFVSN